jgi:hypothetical protein
MLKRVGFALGLCRDTLPHVKCVYGQRRISFGALIYLYKLSALRYVP